MNVETVSDAKLAAKSAAQRMREHRQRMNAAKKETIKEADKKKNRKVLARSSWSLKKKKAEQEKTLNVYFNNLI